MKEPLSLSNTKLSNVQSSAAMHVAAKNHTILIESLLQHQDYLQITLLAAPPAVMLSMAYRNHKEVTKNLDQLTAQKGRQSAGKLKNMIVHC